MSFATIIAAARRSQRFYAALPGKTEIEYAAEIIDAGKTILADRAAGQWSDTSDDKFQTLGAAIHTDPRVIAAAKTRDELYDRFPNLAMRQVNGEITAEEKNLLDETLPRRSAV